MDWEKIVLELPEDTPLPCIRNRWHRLQDGRIVATYTRKELIWALLAIGKLDERILGGTQIEE